MKKASKPLPKKRSSHMRLLTTMFMTLALVFGGVALYARDWPGKSFLASLTFSASGCGNGFIDYNEDCDNGLNGGNGCTSSCTVWAGWVCTAGQCHQIRCGDAIVDIGETCDYHFGEWTTPVGCPTLYYTCPNCTQCIPPQPVCGNGKVETGEGCDDSDYISSNGCSWPSCQVEQGWTCTGTNPSVCTKNPVCGNGLVEDAQGVVWGGGITYGTEGCDDGNTRSGDGCSPSCTIEPNWHCYPGSDPSSCYKTAICGDGYIDQNETCGEPGLAACPTYQMCSQNCTCVAAPYTPSCGNYVIDSGEQCDHGTNNGKAGDTCSSTCKTVTASSSLPTGPVCGNGVAETGEVCGEPGRTCPTGKYCSGCLCYTLASSNSSATSSAIPSATSSSSAADTTTPICGNGIFETGESCSEPGAPACSGNKICLHCLCVTPAANYCAPFCQTGGTTTRCKRVCADFGGIDPIPILCPTGGTVTTFSCIAGPPPSCTYSCN